MVKMDASGAFGCEPCSFMVRWADLYHQVTVLMLLWIAVGACGCIVVCVIKKMKFRLTDRMKLRLCNWERVCSENAATMCYMLVFHILQCILFVERTYSAGVVQYYSIVEVVMSFVYFSELLIWFLSGTLHGSYTRWSRVWISLFIDVFLLGAPFARVSVVDGFQSWFSFTFLASFRCARVLQRYVTLRGVIPKTGVGGITYLLFINLCDVFGAATIIMVLESLGGPYEDPQYNPQSLDTTPRRWRFFSTLYYLIVTVTTVGYGDYAPTSLFGRIFSIFIIGGGVAFFGKLLNQSYEIYLLAQQGLNFFQASKNMHIVVVGRPTVECIQDFILELFHPDHIDEARKYDVCVMLVNAKAVLATKTLMEGHSWQLIREHITILRGSPLLWKDCLRAMMPSAKCVFVLPDFDAPIPADDDAASVLRLISLRRSLPPKVRIVGLLHEAKQKSYLLASGFRTVDVAALDEFKHNCIGKACGGVPGFTPFISNLVKSIAPNQEYGIDEGSAWQREYQLGYGHELYEVKLEPCYVDASFIAVFGDIMQRAVEDHDVYLIGIVQTTGAVCLNPGLDYRIRRGDRGVFMAPDRASIKQCPAFEKLIRFKCQDFNTMFDNLKVEAITAENPKEVVEETWTTVADVVVESMEARPSGFREHMHNLLIDGKTQLDRMHCAYTIGSHEPESPKDTLVLPDIPDGELPENFVGDHVLFCSPQSLSFRWGLDTISRSLKHKMKGSDTTPIVVVLAPGKPLDWEELDICKYYFQGSPLNLFDLERVMYLSARKIVIISPHASSANCADNQILYMTRFIESALGEHGTVMTELILDALHVLLPLGHTETPAITDNTGSNRTSMQLQRAKMDLLEGMAEAQEPYYESSRFAQGNLLIVRKVLTSLMANTLFNPSLPILALKLCEQRFFVVAVPTKWDHSLYRDFLNFLMSKELLPVGIYRTADSLAHDTGARGYMGLVRHGYIFSCPPMSTRITHYDKVLCLVKGDPFG